MPIIRREVQVDVAKGSGWDQDVTELVRRVRGGNKIQIEVQHTNGPQGAVSGAAAGASGLAAGAISTESGLVSHLNEVRGLLGKIEEDILKLVREPFKLKVEIDRTDFDKLLKDAKEGVSIAGSAVGGGTPGTGSTSRRGGGRRRRSPGPDDGEGGDDGKQAEPVYPSSALYPRQRIVQNTRAIRKQEIQFQRRADRNFINEGVKQERQQNSASNLETQTRNAQTAATNAESRASTSETLNKARELRANASLQTATNRISRVTSKTGRRNRSLLTADPYNDEQLRAVRENAEASFAKHQRELEHKAGTSYEAKNKAAQQRYEDNLKEQEDNRSFQARLQLGSQKIEESQTRKQGVVDRRIAKAAKEFEGQTSLQEVGAYLFGGGNNARIAQRAKDADKFATEKGVPGLHEALTEQINNKKLPGLINGRNLLRPEVANQIGFAGVFGGLPGIAAASIGGAVGGLQGAIGASTIQQTIGSIILDPLIRAFTEHKAEFEEAGRTYTRSILGIQSVLQSTTQVIGAGGKVLGGGGVAAQLQFQEKQATEIQLAARKRLLPIGISGGSEATFVQGITSALASRGISTSASGVSKIAGIIGGVIQAQRPNLIDNPNLLLRDINDYLSGGNLASRTILSQLGGIKQSVSGVKSATSEEDIIKSLTNAGAGSYESTFKNSTSVSAIQQRLSGGFDQLKTVAGAEYLNTIKPALSEYAKTVGQPDSENTFKTIGRLFGEVSAAGIKFSNFLLQTGNNLNTATQGLQKFASEMTKLTPVLIAAAGGAAAVKLGQLAVGGGGSGLSQLAGSALGSAIPNGVSAGGLTQGAGRGALASRLGGLAGLARFGVAGAGLFIAKSTVDSLNENQEALDDEAGNNYVKAALASRIAGSKTAPGQSIETFLNAHGLKDKIEADQIEKTPSSTIGGINKLIAQFGGSEELQGKLPSLLRAKEGLQQEEFQSRSGLFQGNFLTDKFALSALSSQSLEDRRNTLTSANAAQQRLIDKEASSAADPQSEKDALKRLKGFQLQQRGLQSSLRQGLGQEGQVEDAGIFGTVGQIGQGLKSTFGKTFASLFIGSAASEGLSKLGIFKEGSAEALTSAQIDKNKTALAEQAGSYNQGIEANKQSLQLGRLNAAVGTDAGADLISKQVEMQRDILKIREDELKVAQQVGEAIKGSFGLVSNAFNGGGAASKQLSSQLNIGIGEQARANNRDQRNIIYGAISDSYRATNDTDNAQANIIRDQFGGDKEAYRKSQQGRLNELKFQNAGNLSGIFNAQSQGLDASSDFSQEGSIFNSRSLRGQLRLNALRGAELSTRGAGLQKLIGNAQGEFNANKLDNPIAAFVAAERVRSLTAQQNQNLGDQQANEVQGKIGGLSIQAASAEYDLAIKRSGQIITEEAQKREELTRGIAATTLQLSQFGESVKQQVASKDSGIYGLAKRYKDLGGNLGASGLDLSDEQLKEVQKKEVESQLNNQLRSIGKGGVGDSLGGPGRLSQFAADQGGQAGYNGPKDAQGNPLTTEFGLQIAGQKAGLTTKLQQDNFALGNLDSQTRLSQAQNEIQKIGLQQSLGGIQVPGSKEIPSLESFGFDSTTAESFQNLLPKGGFENIFKNQSKSNTSNEDKIAIQITTITAAVAKLSDTFVKQGTDVAAMQKSLADIAKTGVSVTNVVETKTSLKK